MRIRRLRPVQRPLAGLLALLALPVLATDICKDTAPDGSVRFVQCQLLEAEAAESAQRLTDPKLRAATEPLGERFSPPFFDFSLRPPRGFEYTPGRNWFTQEGTDNRMIVAEVPAAVDEMVRTIGRGKQESVEIAGLRGTLSTTIQRAPAGSGYPDFTQLKLLLGDEKRTIILSAIAPVEDPSLTAAFRASFESLRFDRDPDEPFWPE